MPNKYETLLLTNLPLFISKYCITVAGASGQFLATPNPAGGTTLAAEYQSIGFQTSQRAMPKAPGNRTTGVSLTAPLLTAVANKLAGGRDDKDMLPFSRATVEVKFQSYQAGVGVPVYLIPYEGGKSRGVKLPAHGADALPAAAAMTATQNGCTVEVSGTQASPYASHTNVADVTVGVSVERFRARRAKMLERVDKLQQRFAAEEGAAGGNAAAPALARRQFGFYPPPIGIVGAAVQQVNYTEIARKLVRSREGVFTLVHTHPNPRPGVGRVDYVACPTAGSIANNTDPLAPPNAILMGVRGAGGWTFYYQVYTLMTFEVRTIEDGKMSTMQPVMNGAIPKRYSCKVILDHGEFWPNVTSNPLWT